MQRVLVGRDSDVQPLAAIRIGSRPATAFARLVGSLRVRLPDEGCPLRGISCKTGLTAGLHFREIETGVRLRFRYLPEGRECRVDGGRSTSEPVLRERTSGPR